MPKVKQKTSSVGVRQTPMLRQYLEQKAQYPDCILFFRLGDFYEMFFEDATQASEVLEIALTARSKGADAYPMCGVPYFSANGYIAKLVERGFKVAVCDQIEDAKFAKGIVKRAVTRVVSPGMITDPDELTANESNYLAAVSAQEADSSSTREYGFSFLDISTSDFRYTQVSSKASLFDELARVRPRELLTGPGWSPEDREELQKRFPNLFIKATDLTTDKEQVGQQRFDETFVGPNATDIHEKSVGLQAAKMGYAYADASLPGSLYHVKRLVPYDPSDHLVVDEYSRINLELTHTLMEGKRKGSLLGAIDRTRSPMGARLLVNWLLFPERSLANINNRADAVEQLVLDSVQRTDLRQCLGNMRDLERLVAKTSVGQANPRDLGTIRDSLAHLPQWIQIVESKTPSPLNNLLGPIDPLLDLFKRIDDVLVDQPPADLSAGGIVRLGFDPTLDELVQLATHGRETIAQMEQDERKATSISSLKIKYNKVFGYFIEVTKPNLHLVPEHYRRKQTTSNSERFETEELKQKEAQILTAHEDRLTKERTIFEQLITEIRRHCEQLLTLSRQIATSDVICSLAELAATQDYCRPKVDNTRVLDIKEGRHPVVEQLMQSERFVPNDIEIDPEQQQLLIITGPNMAGKSTTIRQVALITILAQMGSFVPAAQARIGLVDRIFTRIGASDNLARGQSTFMVEMIETAHILSYATRNSLLILDEIGRGTSTFDGLSIAWAVAEYIHDTIKARSLFATHYHQLSDLATTKSRVRNFTISVKEYQDQIIFLRRLIAGISNRSYGIQVGKLAGLPQAVVDRAVEILANLEKHQFDEIGAPAISGSKKKSDNKVQLQLFAPSRSALEEEIKQLNLDSITPLEALNLLHHYKEMSR